MTNRSDFRKPEWRATSFEWLRSVNGLWDEETKFNGSYFSLVGKQGTEMFDTFAPTLRTPKQCIGVDTDPGVILHHLARNPPGTAESWDLLYGDAYEIAVNLSRKKREYPVMVFDFDGTNLAGNETWWEKEGPMLAKVVENTLKHSPCCCLILNQSIDRGEETPKNLLIKQTQLLCKTFAPWNIHPRRFLGTDMHYVNKVVKVESQPRFLGYAGAYQVYMSSVLRMVTLRMAFHAGGLVNIHREAKS